MGEGTFGEVFKAVDDASGVVVAIKRIRGGTEEDGLPSTALREVILLRDLEHPNVVRLEDVLFDEPAQCLYLVFEWLDTDLRRFMDMLGRRAAVARAAAAAAAAASSGAPAASIVPAASGHRPPPTGLDSHNLRAFMFQLVTGAAYIHDRRIVHRDLKPANILVTARGTDSLKIADFGLARLCSPARTVLTDEVVTLWYRAPEILLGCDTYTSAVDVWSLGCIFAELASGRPLFPGDSGIGQLTRIFQLLGTPSEASWRGVTTFPYWRATIPAFRSHRLTTVVPALDAAGLDLLQVCCCGGGSHTLTSHPRTYPLAPTRNHTWRRAC